MDELRGHEPITSALAAWAGSDPDAPVLVTEQGVLTCSGLVRGVRAMERRLADEGIGAGRAVVLVAPSSAAWLVGLLAAYARGAVVAPVAADAGLDERRLVLEKLRPDAVLHWGTSAWTQRPTATTELAEPAAAPWLEIALDELGGEPADRDLDPPPTVARSLDAEAVIFYTSGTTGTPRAVVHSLRSLVTSALGRPLGRAVLDPDGAAGERRNELAGLRIFTSYPFASIAGFIVVLRALLQRHTVVTLTRFHPRRALELIERWRVAGILGGPTHVRLMTRLRDFDRHDLGSVRFVSLGGDRVSRDLALAVEDAFGCPVGITYGTTELGGAATMSRLNDPPETRIGAVGRPVEGVEVRVLDEAGMDVEPGAEGELFVRSPSQALGLRGEEGVEPLTGRDGWVATGDLAIRDQQGVLHIVGRKRGLIIRGGRKIAPEEVEAVLLTEPGVEAARVHAITDDDGTQRVSATIVPSGMPEEALSVALLRRCRERLAPYKVPDRIDMVSRLPMTHTGKVRRGDA
jgi:long-chain acyl-CoA synthetase